VDADEATKAALLVLLGLLPLAVPEAELPLLWDDAALVGVALAAFAELAAEIPLPVAVPVPVAVPEPEPEPLSMTAVLRQLLSVPGLIVAEAAKACMPVLSLRAAMKLVLAWRSTSHVKVVPVWVGNCFIAA